MLMHPIERFNFDIKPKKERFFLTPLAFALSFPEMWQRHAKVNKVHMEDLEPPYVLLCTHHAFVDFKVTTKAIFPHRANYVVAIDGFIGREWLLRNVGAICKRKFTNDTRLIKQIKYSLDKLNDICAIYPEARYSLVGTTAILPESLGKMVKMLKYPVVVLNMHGNYLSQPAWHLEKRKVDLVADMTQILTKKEMASLSIDEINKKINDAFVYDEYQWQYENKIKIDFKDRAKNLHKVLYQCPHCLTESQMDSDGYKIWCNQCQKSYEMDLYGKLKAITGDTVFSHIPDWFEWQREQVKKQIDNHQYRFEDDVKIESLPNAKGYIPLGEGHLVHNEQGFHLTGKDLEGPLDLFKKPLSLYGLHVEYNYFGKGDCIDLSTLNDTYYIYPTKQNVVTKLHFAVEELYKIEKQKLNNV